MTMHIQGYITVSAFIISFMAYLVLYELYRESLICRIKNIKLRIFLIDWCWESFSFSVAVLFVTGLLCFVY